MERKFVDRPNWKRMLERRFKLSYVESNDFSGYVSAIFMDKVREPLIVEVTGRQFPIVDNGYIWLQHLPDNENFSLTTMFDSQGNVVQWYFDITKQNGVSEEGMPYFDDLYLDIVILPSSDIIILDEDELQDALNAGEISKAEYDMAYGKADEIINGIGKDVNVLRAFSDKYLGYMQGMAE